jgi:putative heme iron utilization protein
MNDDHSDAILLYAQVFGNTPDAEAARMLKIEPASMIVEAQVSGEARSLRIEFDHTLTDSEDAHQTLISMVKQDRSTAKE